MLAAEVRLEHPQPTAESEDNVSSAEVLTVLERRDQAIEQLDLGHQALKQALEGLEAEDAFLGSRWSVREVLLHLDSENFIDALERIASGEQDMLPAFSTRDDQLRKEWDRLEDTHQRFRSLAIGLSENQLARPVTPPNFHNSYPGLTMLELIERISGHESTHARQIEETRKYVAAFKSREMALNIVELGDGDPVRVSQMVKELLKHADYVVGTPAALELVRPWGRGVELTLSPDNAEEIIARMGREVRSGIWAVVCCLGNLDEDRDNILALSKQYADTVAIRWQCESEV